MGRGRKRWQSGITAAAAALSGSLVGCTGSDDAPPPRYEATPGTTIVFETGVPGAVDACDGLWAVDARRGPVRFLVGARSDDEEPAIPSFASDGATLAFALFGEGYESDLYALRASSGEVARVASRTAVLFLREWSPATDELLTSRVRERRKGYELVVVRPDGEIRVVDEDPQSIDYSWSPDGERLAYSATDRERRRAYLWVMSADGGDVREVTELEEDGGEAFPAWSPDGRTLAYVRDGDLWLVDVDEGNPRRLAAGPVADGRAVVWLPNGRQLLLVRELSGTAADAYLGDVVRVDVESGEVSPYLERVVPVAPSPGGDEFVFLRLHRDVPVPGGLFAPENMYSIRVAPLAGGGERTIGVLHESVLRHGSRPVWQPRASALNPATGAFRPRRAGFCSRQLEAYRERLAG